MFPFLFGTRTLRKECSTSLNYIVNDISCAIYLEFHVICLYKAIIKKLLPFVFLIVSENGSESVLDFSVQLFLKVTDR